MKNLNVTSKNIFDDSYQSFVTASESQSIIEFFKDKPYYQRTAKLAVFLSVLAVVCNVVSGFTESVFLQSKFNLFIPIYALSIVLVLAVVLIIEGIKRYTLPQFFRYWFQYRKVDLINLSIYVLAVSLSVWLSYNGSKFLPSMVAEAEVVNIDNITASYDTKIQIADSTTKAYFNANSWHEKLDGSSRPTYNKLAETSINLQSEKTEAIRNAKQENKDITSDWKEQNTKDGLQLGYITIASEIVLFLIVAFLIYRKWRHVAQFANIENIEAEETIIRTVESTTTPSSSSLPLRNENRIKTVKTVKVDNNENRIKDNLRSCKHCENDYTIRHHKQKYCSDNCRITAYNKRNGKNLKYRIVTN